MSGSAFHEIPQSVLQQWQLDAATGEHPRQPDVAIPVTIVLSLSVLIFVGFRAWVRLRIQRKADISDWLIFACTPMTIAYLIMVGICTQTYYNRHLWDLSDHDRVIALRYFFFGYFFYFWNSALIRLSIMFFYLSLTDRTINKKFVLIVYATIVFTIMYWIVFDVSLIFTCRPVQAFWNRADPVWVQAHEYQCFDEGSHIMAASAISALDLFIAVLPAMIFWNLRLPRRQKIALWALFAIGACTGVASLVRMYFIYLDFWKSYDFTWIGYEIWLWTSTELAVAIVCASAPSLKTIFIKFFGETGVRATMRRSIGQITGRTFDGTNASRAPPTQKAMASQFLDSTNELNAYEDDEKPCPPSGFWEDVTTRLAPRKLFTRNPKTKSGCDVEMLSHPSTSSTSNPPSKTAPDEAWTAYDRAGFGGGGKGTTTVTSLSRAASRASTVPGGERHCSDEDASPLPDMPPLPHVFGERGGEDEMVVHVQTMVEISERRVVGGGGGGGGEVGDVRWLGVLV